MAGLYEGRGARTRTCACMARGIGGNATLTELNRVSVLNAATRP